MKRQYMWGSAAGLAVFVLSGCASAGVGDSPAPGGAIEVAVSSICTAGSSPDCVAVNGEHVLVTDDAFQKVDVKAVAVADAPSGNAVDLELTSDGASVLKATTTAASEAGEEARLVIRAGDRVISAVRAAEPVSDDHLTVQLPDDVTAEEFTAEIRGS